MIVSEESKMSRDRISNLPDDVINHILPRLPFRDAARTSVLSTKWRYKWSELPYLVFKFNDDRVPETIIDHTLLLHRGQILKFELVYDAMHLDQAISRWITHLSNFHQHLKELKIMPLGWGDRVPSCLFSFQSLTHLSLSYFTVVKLPSTFKGFPNLKSLELSFLMMEKDDLENLISSCPMLNRLVLPSLHDLSNLTIIAPNLHYFTICGGDWESFQGISFENTSRLAIVTVSLYGDRNLRACRNSSNLLKFCGQLPTIRYLSISSLFLKYLVVGVVRGETRVSCPSLDSLSLDISLNYPEDCLNAVSIISTFSNLRKLQIQNMQAEYDTEQEVDFLEDYEEVNFLEDYDFHCRFTKLQIVEISGIGISGKKLELDFVKFMLSNSPDLEQMVVRPNIRDDAIKELSLVVKLLSFRRASDRARVIFLTNF